MPHLKPLRPRNGPILDYIANLPEAERADVMARVEAVLNTPDGSILLELLEKSVALRLVDMAADPRACEYANAQRFIVSDLQLIARTENAYLSPTATGRPQRTR